MCLKISLNLNMLLNMNYLYKTYINKTLKLKIRQLSTTSPLHFVLKDI